jgi:hypothetical protein
MKKITLEAEGKKTRVKDNEGGGREWQDAFDRLIGRLYPGYYCESIAWANLDLREQKDYMPLPSSLTVRPVRTIGGMQETLRYFIEVWIIIDAPIGQRGLKVKTLRKAELIRAIESKGLYCKVRIAKCGEVTGMLKTENYRYNVQTNMGGRRYIGQYGDTGLMRDYETKKES